MKKDNWLVDINSTKFGEKPDECFYCKQKIGMRHKYKCIIPQKTVVVDFTVRVVVEVPHFYEKYNIEHKYNDGTWCADNLVDMIDKKGEDCLCNHTTAKYIREATKQDEDNWKGEENGPE
jgi:hypothetical protein